MEQIFTYIHVLLRRGLLSLLFKNIKMHLAELNFLCLAKNMDLRGNLPV